MLSIVGYSVVFMTVQRGLAGEFQPGAVLRRRILRKMWSNPIWKDCIGARGASFVGSGPARAFRLLGRARHHDRNYDIGIVERPAQFKWRRTYREKLRSDGGAGLEAAPDKAA